MSVSQWVRSATAVLHKELSVEWRSRQGLGSTLLFSVSSLTAMAYVLAFKTVAVDVKAALVWLIILFAAMSGLARTFVREEDTGTADSLRMAAPATAVLAGKMIFNALLTVAVEIVSVPLFLMIMPIMRPHIDYGLLVAVMALGGIGLAAAATFVAALISQATAGGARGALFFVVAFPALVPVLMSAVSGTLAALASDPTTADMAHNSLVVLGTYDVVAITAAFLLFGWVWTEA